MLGFPHPDKPCIKPCVLDFKTPTVRETTSLVAVECFPLSLAWVQGLRGTEPSLCHWHSSFIQYSVCFVVHLPFLDRLHEKKGQLYSM